MPDMGWAYAFSAISRGLLFWFIFLIYLTQHVIRMPTTASSIVNSPLLILPLARRPQIVAVTKADLPITRDRFPEAQEVFARHEQNCIASLR